LLGAPRLHYLRFSSLRLVTIRPFPSVPPVWRPVPRLSAAGEGPFTDPSGSRKSLFEILVTFLNLIGQTGLISPF
ncbi:hypothetical protein, partial [Albibacillus kandeliae]|uniref:hypothetical protein n=1 Tax=Albibacillus kandeliae TaxID=2174228 RepID=UPI001E3D39A3